MHRYEIENPEKSLTRSENEIVRKSQTGAAIDADSLRTIRAIILINDYAKY